MSEQEPQRDGGAGEPGTGKSRESRLLFVVARGHADLRAAIERVLRGLPGLEVIEDRRGDETLLPRSGLEPRGDDRSAPGDPEPDYRSDPVTATAPTLCFARAPRSAWVNFLPRRA